MKIPSPISHCPRPVERKTARPIAAHRHGAVNHRQSAVALIITVILLAVVTFMAVTFLALSKRERGSVATTTDAATAQLAAADALAAAEAQIMANTLAATNPYNFGLLVSTNFINPAGFNPGVAGFSPTNVNYDHLISGGVYSEDDFLQNLANLQYLPRPPVYATNYLYRGNELQFYLDLNRNGVDDTNGPGPVLSGNPALPWYDTNGYPTATYSPPDVLSNNFVGDPEWVGVLQHPDQPYGPNNPFVARYAFIAVPIGNALDLNAIYNQAASRKVNPASAGADGFMRNQGVGSWEINLAAFLADLNTNEWLPLAPPDNNYYAYDEPGNYNEGIAFQDALSLLSYRYGYDYNSLLPVGGPRGMLTKFSFWPFQNGIDYYSDKPLLRQNLTWPWAGADNTNHFFDMQELFDPNKVNVGAISPLNSFTNRLLSAGFGLSSYDRYTYYRLQAQMGVDSAPMRDQINLNYANAAAYFNQYGVVTNITYYPGAETNLAPWQPLQFFTIAADRMLRAYSQEWITESPSNYLVTYGIYTNISTFNPLTNPTNVPMPFSITNIPVLVNNQFVYTPAIQRVLQLAANMYDATTNNININNNRYNYNFPSVFRPIFMITTNGAAPGYTNVYVAGYEPVGYNGQIGAVDGPGDYQLARPLTVADLLNPANETSSPPGYGYSALSPGSGIYTNANVYGVPWIIGAKQGFPHFNKFDFESAFQLTRKLQATRLSTNDVFPDGYSFNQRFILSLSNQFGVECWNSYTNSFNDGVAIYVRDDLRDAVLTNDEHFGTNASIFLTGGCQVPNGTWNVWPGYNSATDPFGSLQSFQIPMYTNVVVITNSMYRFNVGNTVPEPGDPGYGTPYLTTNLSAPFESDIPSINGSIYPQPHWWLITSNDLQVFMLDTNVFPNHVIDYVQLSGPNSVRDLTSEIVSNWDAPVNATGPSGDQLWNTNFQNGQPIGFVSQVGVSVGNYQAGSASGTWNQTDPTLLQYEIAGFMAFLGYTPPPAQNGVEAQYIALGATSLSNQVPYSPTATVVQNVSWQANDPLVHYVASDLNWPGAVVYGRTATSLTNDSPNGVLGQLNQSYRPWGGNPILTNADPNAFNLAVKDPLVWRSDYWDFPAYKLPTIGWLGRVHRGTPWQTIYLKATNILQGTQMLGSTPVYVGTNTWTQWTGDLQYRPSPYYDTNYDAVNTAPVQDRLLFDLFTTAPNANATRGQLSVNVGANDPGNPQAGLAAWSAVFSGIVVPTNLFGGYTTINPAGPVALLTPSPLWEIVTNINGTRANFVNEDGLKGTFENVGDILAAPDLSDQSPYLANLNRTNAVSNEMYDWLPQQVLSLLRVSGTPESPMRYVIYCYGQTLKPAPNGINTGSQTINGNQSAFGMITNYQVVAESASRAVVNFGSVMTNTVTVTNGDFGYQILENVPAVTNNTAQIRQFNVLPPY